MFNHGTLCREIATEGGDPISDTRYILILVKIFRDSGVFPVKIREWNNLEEEDKTVAKCEIFFIRAHVNRLDDTMQGALLSANAAKSNVAQPAKPPATTHNTDTMTLHGKWGYCWSHGLCQHSSTDCRSMALNHKQAATFDNPMGGSTEIRFPGYR